MSSISQNLRFLIFGLLVSLFGVACSTRPSVQHSPPFHKKVSRYSEEPKRIMVFLDGTANEWDSRTNVRRLYEMISCLDDPKTPCIYADGVGTSSRVLTGLALGRGMKSRVVEGYLFISKHYNPGDQIYIYGFSRGALQARTLAGLISYCGVLPRNTGRPQVAANEVWSLCKRVEESDVSAQEWAEAVAGKSPPMRTRFPDMVDTHWAEVTFLGIWDTVPGSQLKKYGPYREEVAFPEGTRYKVGAYPPIRNIAHAMSLDEMRSKFIPIQMAPPVDCTRTKLSEIWFPGAHSDVGGGYADSTGLPGLSLNWMIGKMKEVDSHWAYLPEVFEDSSAAQHDSASEFPNNFGSRRVEREIAGPYEVHQSVEEREALESGVWIRKSKKYGENKEPYPPQFTTGS